MRNTHGRFIGQDLMRGENPNIQPGRRRPTDRDRPSTTGGPTNRGGEARGGDADAYTPAHTWRGEGGGEVARAYDFDLSPAPEFISSGQKTDLHLTSGNTGTSIFDPTLCELAYRWFAPAKGKILDPFAGGSCRGIIASRLGLRYAGIELRSEQIAANQQQADAICRSGEPRPIWIEGDSLRCLDRFPENGADLIFTCPPYGDLERYSEDPADLSTMPIERFDEAMRLIILKSCRALAPDRFSIWVCSDYRLQDGGYALFPSKIRLWHRDAGLRLYNEAILLNAIGSLPIRAGKQFAASRKLGRGHQEILIFLKGDEKRATKAMAPIEAGLIDAAIEQATAEAH